MKITPDHLARGAFIYIRQSTVDQLANNHGSRRRQYGLADRARALGWTDVTVIDDDLGRSGSGVSRPGFERLLAAICEGRVGAVFAIEASRLARNGRDWHTLIEFWCPWRAVLLEIARRAADDHAAGGELARDKTRVRKLSDPHGDIETFVDQIGDTLAQNQFDGDRRKARRKIGNGGRQLHNTESRRGIDAQL